jgi:hypothetical protein
MGGPMHQLPPLYQGHQSIHQGQVNKYHVQHNNYLRQAANYQPNYLNPPQHSIDQTNNKLGSHISASSNFQMNKNIG